MYKTKWGSYPETLLVFPVEPEVVIDLREEVSPETREALAAIGLDQPFGVVTAFNPRGEVLSPDENAKRMRDFEFQLDVAGHKFLDVDGCSTDRAHCERSVALSIERQEVIEIAKKWDQVAIFWWDGETFWIDGAVVEGSEKLPLSE